MTDIRYDLWEPVIGLEIHVQLNTKSKLFSCAPSRFGDEPNTNITDVCTGQPGSLPVLNKEAVRKAVQFGCAIHAEISLFSKFDRKSYFYPDSPRNYQITQYDEPILIGGHVPIELHGHIQKIAVSRAHLEDDAGMLKHFTHCAGVDYNRAGVALLEIVSEPCMHSPKEAAAYAMAVKAIMEYIDASDTNMEEGSLRMDVNVSVRPKGDTILRSKVEIKNMNSFNHMELAIESEIRRQIRAYEKKPHLPFKEVVTTGTYRFCLEKKETVLMREKEEAADYRYFPEPDLVPLILTQEYIDEIRNSLPELPYARYQRYLSTLQLSPAAAELLVNNKPLSDYFEKALTLAKNPKHLCNWITIEFVGRLKESGKSLTESGILSEHIASLVNMIDEGTLTGRIAKSVADDMLAHPGKDPVLIVQENTAYRPLNDNSAIEALIDQVLTENPQSIADFHAGKTKALGFLIGQVMKLCEGKASPPLVNTLLKKRLGS